MPRASISESKTGFIEWWEKVDLEERSAIDVRLARKAFIAGYREAANPTRKTYRFAAGRWIVTVTAPSLAEAKAEARRKLDMRAEKFLASAPRSGWALTLIPKSRG